MMIMMLIDDCCCCCCCYDANRRLLLLLLLLLLDLFEHDGSRLAPVDVFVIGLNNKDGIVGVVGSPPMHPPCLFRTVTVVEGTTTKALEKIMAGSKSSTGSSKGTNSDEIL